MPKPVSQGGREGENESVLLEIMLGLAGSVTMAVGVGIGCLTGGGLAFEEVSHFVAFGRAGVV